MPEITPATPKRTRKSRTAAGHSQTVALRSGGSITLSGDFNLFSMSPADVAFVSELGATMRKYTDATETTAKMAIPGEVNRPQAVTRAAQSVTPPVSTNVGNPGTQKPS